MERNYESVCISSIARVILGEYDVDVCNALRFEFIKDFILGAINQGATAYDAFPSVQSAMRAGCVRTTSQIVHLVE